MCSQDDLLTLAVQLVFKRSGEIDIPKDKSTQLSVYLDQLAGDDERTEELHLFTGSKADRLTPAWPPPRPRADYDVMYILPSIFDVNLFREEGLYIDCEDNPPGHVVVRVGSGKLDEIEDCLTTSNGKRYLSAECLRQKSLSRAKERFSDICVDKKYWSVVKEYFKGPAYCMETINGQSTDTLHAVVCKKPFDEMTLFVTRNEFSNFSKHIPFERICKQRGLLVPKAHIYCDRDKTEIQFRKSFSTQEMLLLRSLPAWARQAAVTFKYIVKEATDDISSEHFVEQIDTERMMRSYHMKTVIMWTLEQMTDGDWEAASAVRLLKNMIERLLEYLDKGRLPHYWVPDCDLFEGMSDAYIGAVNERVRDMKSGLAAAVLRFKSSAQYMPRDKYISMFEIEKTMLWHGHREQVLAASIISTIWGMLERVQHISEAPYLLDAITDMFVQEINIHEEHGQTLTFLETLKFLKVMVMLTIKSPGRFSQRCWEARVPDLLRLLSTCAYSLNEAGHQEQSAAVHTIEVLLHMALTEGTQDISYETRSTDHQILSRLARWHLQEALEVLPAKTICSALQTFSEFPIFENYEWENQIDHKLIKCAGKLMDYLQTALHPYACKKDRIAATKGEDEQIKDDAARQGLYFDESLGKGRCFSCSLVITHPCGIRDHDEDCEQIEFLLATLSSLRSESVLFPLYGNKFAREETYIDWPESLGHLREMAMQAGYFYAGCEMGTEEDVTKHTLYTMCCGKPVRLWDTCKYTDQAAHVWLPQPRHCPYISSVLDSTVDEFTNLDESSRSSLKFYFQFLVHTVRVSGSANSHFNKLDDDAKQKLKRVINSLCIIQSQ